MVSNVYERMRERLFPLPKQFNQMVLESYLWGNQRFPQVTQGIAINFADFVLSQPNFDPVRLVERKLSPAELVALGDTMDKTHAAFGIPVATDRGQEMVKAAVMKKRGVAERYVVVKLVADEMLQVLWAGFKERSLLCIALVAGLDEESPAWPSANIDNDVDIPSFKDTGRKLYDVARLREFSKFITQPQNLNRAREIIHSFKETIESSEGLRIGREIRTNASEGVAAEDPAVKAAKGNKVDELAQQLVELCIERYLQTHDVPDDELDKLEKAAAGLNEL